MMGLGFVMKWVTMLLSLPACTRSVTLAQIDLTRLMGTARIDIDATGLATGLIVLNAGKVHSGGDVAFFLVSNGRESPFAVSGSTASFLGMGKDQTILMSDPVPAEAGSGIAIVLRDQQHDIDRAQGLVPPLPRPDGFDEGDLKQAKDTLDIRWRADKGFISGIEVSGPNTFLRQYPVENESSYYSETVAGQVLADLRSGNARLILVQRHVVHRPQRGDGESPAPVIDRLEITNSRKLFP